MGSSRRQASSQGESLVSVAVGVEEEGERRGVAGAFVVEVGDGESRVGARVGRGGAGGAGGGGAGEGAPFSQSASVILPRIPLNGREPGGDGQRQRLSSLDLLHIALASQP